MAFEPKDGSGSLFKNDRREKESQPNYKGSIRIGGKDYWLSAWLKDGDKGKWMSLSAEPKDKQGNGQKAPQRAPQRPQQDDSEVPF